MPFESFSPHQLQLTVLDIEERLLLDLVRRMHNHHDSPPTFEVSEISKNL